MNKWTTLDLIAPAIRATVQKVKYGSATVPELVARLRQEADKLENAYRAEENRKGQESLDLTARFDVV